MNSKISSDTKLTLINESFENGSQNKVTLTYVSGSYSATDYNIFVTEPNTKNVEKLSTRNYLNLSSPTKDSVSSDLNGGSGTLLIR